MSFQTELQEEGVINFPVPLLAILELSLDDWDSLVWFRHPLQEQYLLPEECNVPGG